jgi:phage gpG-like protein
MATAEPPDAFLADAQRGLTEAVRQALAQLRSAVALQFATQGAAYGTPWQPRKNDRDPGRPLLVASGRLLESLVNPLSPEHVEEVTPHTDGYEIMFGTTVPYAAFLQNGTRFMPARPFLAGSMLTGA